MRALALTAVAALLLAPAAAAQTLVDGARRIELSGAPARDPAKHRTVELTHAADVAAVLSAVRSGWKDGRLLDDAEGAAIRFLTADGAVLAQGRLLAKDGERGWRCVLELRQAQGPTRTFEVAGRVAWLLVPLLSADEGRPACPSCGAERFAAPVLFGPPPTPEVSKGVRRGEAFFGSSGDLSYRWRCKACLHEWPAALEGR